MGMAIAYLQLDKHLDVDAGRAQAVRSLQCLLHLLVQLVEEGLDGGPVIDVELVLRTRAPLVSAGSL